MSKRLSFFIVCFSFLPICNLTLDAQQKIATVGKMDGRRGGTIVNGVGWNSTTKNSTTKNSKSSRLPIQPKPLTERDRSVGRMDDDSTIELPALSDWPRKTISQIQLSPAGSGKTPSDDSNRLLEKYVRDWSLMETREKVFSWESPNLRYQPLLFEDIALERNGQVVLNDNFQTVVSAIHFFYIGCFAAFACSSRSGVQLRLPAWVRSPRKLFAEDISTSVLGAESLTRSA